jgi:CRP-like cAMP-binding protein
VTINFTEILNPEELSLLEQTRNLYQVKKSQSVFLEGRNPSGVYFLVNGKIKLFTTDAQGREQIIHLAKPGDLMGYRALLGNDTYSCTGSALEDSEVWFIPKTTFFTLLDGNAAFSHAIIKLLTAELRHAEHHLAGLARKPVKSRLAEVVLLLADTYGFEKDGETIAVSLTREELAGMVGTATETAIRLLNSLREEGMVATEGKKVRLLNRAALAHCSENA